MKKYCRFAVCILIIILLPGCWNSKDIQNMAYVTAIGLDYENGKYISYIQVLNFSNIAVTEGREVGKVLPVWIGNGEGQTISESLSSIYTTSERRVFWGHMKSIVCTDRLLRHNINEVFDLLNRHRENRYNVLLYGTKNPIHEILTEKSILNFSPLETVLESPQQIFTQRSFILPTYEFKVLSQLNESSGTAILPSITIDHNDWYEDKKDKPMLRIDGAFFFVNRKLSGWLSEEDLKGTRWIQRRMEVSPINVPDNSDPIANLSLRKPHFVVEPVLEKEKIYFNIRVGLKGSVALLIKDIDEVSLEKQAADVVKQEIIHSFRKGISIKSDVFMLEDKLYRKHPQKWEELRKKQTLF
ncbi:MULTISPECIES: Ger(x)C family spore germination protein [Paenibacillus]|uniref:Ger(x)C family spore germination protein n=1 Tax=Paenibacillus TaxID=44249 RepID=UPI00142D70FF|nr:Ger(x)C family spore germination protein [Paenibacillus rhizosphaerae]